MHMCSFPIFFPPTLFVPLYFRLPENEFGNIVRFVAVVAVVATAFFLSESIGYYQITQNNMCRKLNPTALKFVWMFYKRCYR